MTHKYNKYMELFVQWVQQEKDKLAKLPEAEHVEIVLDNDATEQEVYEYLHGKPDEDDMQ